MRLFPPGNQLNAHQRIYYLAAAYFHTMLLHTNQLSTAETQYFLQHIVAPRPICLASTIDINGNVNLSPFSFFNMFSSAPPVIIFSPARRVRDNTTKHTLQNVLEVPEVVVNIVTFNMVQQVSLASCEYPKGTDEFIKAGFTKEKAHIVSPPMVNESKAKLECRVTEVKSLGKNGGAGQLIIAEVLCMHINDELFNSDKQFLQEKMEHVARLGGDWYARISEENLFRVKKPNVKLGVGLDALPKWIRQSTVLTGNHLGRLANVETIPVKKIVFDDQKLIAIKRSVNKEEMRLQGEFYAAELLNEDRVDEAWQVLLQTHNVDV